MFPLFSSTIRIMAGLYLLLETLQGRNVVKGNYSVGNSILLNLKTHLVVILTFHPTKSGWFNLISDNQNHYHPIIYFNIFCKIDRIHINYRYTFLE